MTNKELLRNIRQDLKDDCIAIKEVQDNPEDFNKKELLNILRSIKISSSSIISDIDAEIIPEEDVIEND